jgi:hypothetical protein
LTRQRGPFLPYEGGEPYLFVSYAHLDRDVVYAELARLYEQGVRLWYDEGIHAGEEWPEKVVSNSLCHSAGLILFLTCSSLGRKEVGRELSLADEFKIPILVIALESIDLETKKAHAGSYRIIQTLQWVMKYETALEDYWEGLEKAVPPTVRGPARCLSRDGDAHLVLRRCLSARPPGVKQWAAVEDSTCVVQGSELRLLVQPEQQCFGATVIESVGRDGTVVDTVVFAFHGAGNIGWRLEQAVWNVVPGPEDVLREDDPDSISSWRIGLVITATEDHPLLGDLRQMQGSKRRSLALAVDRSAGTPRRLLLPDVACQAYALPSGTQALALEGASAIVDWATLRFVRTSLA